jgi:hypothetical protein
MPAKKQSRTAVPVTVTPAQVTVSGEVLYNVHTAITELREQVVRTGNTSGHTERKVEDLASLVEEMLMRMRTLEAHVDAIGVHVGIPDMNAIPIPSSSEDEDEAKTSSDEASE